jgi:hypothetical protein
MKLGLSLQGGRSQTCTFRDTFRIMLLFADHKEQLISRLIRIIYNITGGRQDMLPYCTVCLLYIAVFILE